MGDSLQREAQCRIWRTAARTTVAVLLVVAGILGAAGVAEAQYRRSGGNFFEQLFGGGLFQPQPRQPQMQPREPSAQPQSDYSRAPAPRKTDKNDIEPTTTVMVLGDSMADWLAFGLENTFSDTPEVGVVRKHKVHSGLIRYESRGDLDWPHVARDILSKEKADFVVVMLGLNDRTAIREPPRKKETDVAKDRPGRKDQQPKNEADASKNDPKNAGKSSEGRDGVAASNEAGRERSDDESDDPQNLVASEPVRAPGSSNEFRSDRWAELYSRKIDDMIAAAKSKGVPVIWVGLPSIRGTRSTSDALYLNDLFRVRAQKAGIIYVDVWDGFVDENNRYSLHGPDVEGQTRRLRAYDGVHFTSYGARKLAHYVDREIRRLMSGRAMPVALPSDAPAHDTDAPAGRPLAGPVVPLTGAAGDGRELLGGGRNAGVNDAVAARVLVRGEPLAAPVGRADNFAWPRGEVGVAPVSGGAASVPVAAPATPPVAVAPTTAAAPAIEAAKKPVARPSSQPVATPNSADQQPRRAPPAPERRTAGGNATGTSPGGVVRPPAAIPQQRSAPRQPERPRLEDGFFGLFR
jgi:hypothetical protein